MNRRWILIRACVAALVAASVAVSFVACGKDTVDASTPVAEVGDKVLTEGQLRAMVGGTSDEPAGPEERWAAVDRWVSRELLYKEAVARDIDTREDIALQIDAATREIVINAYLDRTFGRELEVTEDEIRHYYDEHRALFRRPETSVHVKRVSVDNLPEAQRLYYELAKSPGEFDSVLRLQSTDPANAEGGDIAFLSAATAQTPEMWTAIQNLSVGQVSRPVNVDDAWDIFLVLDRRPAGGTMALDEVRLEIVNRVRTMKRLTVLGDVVAQLRSKRKFTLHQDLIGPRETQDTTPAIPDTGSILKDVEANE